MLRKREAAAILWRNEVRGFKHWFGTNYDDAIARLMRVLADKGMPQFVADLTVDLQNNHKPKSETE